MDGGLEVAKISTPDAMEARRLGAAAMAKKLKMLANSTAWRGLSTPVETTVAIEFAASWKPFMKSKARARATSTITT